MINSPSVSAAALASMIFTTPLGAPMTSAQMLQAAPAFPASGFSGKRPTRPCDQNLVKDLEVGGPITLVLAREFKNGQEVPISHQPGIDAPERGSIVVKNGTLCVVKIIVGPGVDGPAAEWSTTRGMGIEIWLPDPQKWQGRSFNIFPSGWNGLPSIASSTSFFAESVHYATEQGFVSAATDGGNPPPQDASMRYGSGMTFMLPDGSINKVAWRNYVGGATHAMAQSVKEVARRYYGTAPRYNYLTGCSSGGRAVYASAQMHPGDYQGLLAECPSLVQSHLHLSLIYPQIVMQRDLGGKMLTRAQLDLASRAAVRACDATLTGQHDGYITDWNKCNYDPTKDREVLCPSDGGRAGPANCLTQRQAAAINKIWYGPTRDGSAPPPESDNGQSQFRAPNHMWWGLHRGVDLWDTAEHEDGVPKPFLAPLWQLPLSAENSSLMTPLWKVGDLAGVDGWKDMSYADLADAMDRGLLLQPWFSNINSDDPDLREFAAKGGKLLTQHSGADQYSSAANSVNYFLRVSGVVGGVAEVQKFHRLFIVPGAGHCGGYGTVGGAVAPLLARDQMLEALVAWVERGEAPAQLVAKTAHEAQLRRTRPICMYPDKIRYDGGDVDSAASFSCVKR